MEGACTSKKVQFTTNDEVAEWFVSAAKDAGISQPEFFDQMRKIVSEASLAEEHPAYAATLASFDSMVTRMRDLVSGLVATADESVESARLETADEMTRLRESNAALSESLAQAEAERDAAVSEAKEAKRVANEAKDEAEALRGRAARVDECDQRLDALRDELDAARKAKDVAEADARDARTELAQAQHDADMQRQLVARSDAEIARLREMIDKLQDKLLNKE